MSKIVGIVTPTHNSASTIAATLDSIKKQSYPFFEVFIVDDHSTDDTVKIVKEYSKNDSRFHLIELTKTTGAAAARNKAIEAIHKAKNNSYIAFLDGDDTWSKDKLKTEVTFMEKTGTPFSYGDYKIIQKNHPTKYRRSPHKMSYRRMLLGCSVGCLTVMYDINKVGKISIPNLEKRNDYALWCVILKRVKYGKKYPGTLATYNRNSYGISSGKKVHLIKYHYRMHRSANGFNPLIASLLTLTNIINYIYNITFGEKVIK